MQVIDITFDRAAGPEGLLPALQEVCNQAQAAVEQKFAFIVLSDRYVVLVVSEHVQSAVHLLRDDYIGAVEPTCFVLHASCTLIHTDHLLCNHVLKAYLTMCMRRAYVD